MKDKKIIFISIVSMTIVIVILLVIGILNNVSFNKFEDSENNSESILKNEDEIENDKSYKNDLIGQLSNTYTICIDPGHGGTVSETAPDLQEEEKNDVLELGLILRDLFDDSNVTVIMTRDSDVSVELEQRAKIANDSNCDLFISLHRNISDVGDDINGVEVWKALNKGDICDKLCENLHDELCEFGFNDRKIREGSQTNPNQDYIVNKETNMPSVLLELGFMTNDTDNDLFRNHEEELAKAIYDGIIKTLIYIDEN